jgi:hypothetical protein
LIQLQRLTGVCIAFNDQPSLAARCGGFPEDERPLRGRGLFGVGYRPGAFQAWKAVQRLTTTSMSRFIALQ